MKKTTFDVLGMTCASCQANVTKAVSKLEGVDAVDVSLLSNSMKVEYDPETVTPQQIEAAVSNIGYEAVEKGQMLKEGGQTNSLQAEWDARQKRSREEMAERKHALIASLILLAILMCFSMLPMFGVFSFFMDMKWMMVSSICQLVLCLFILFYQRSFFMHGFKALFKKAPNMDSLVAVGSGASFAYGLYGILLMAYGYGIMDHTLIHEGMNSLYFEGAAMIVTLVSLGKYLEARSKSKTGDALGKLVDLAPKTAVIERDGMEIQVGADEVHAGDIVIIRPGQRIPVDGIVASGTGYVDQAAITGESIPVEKVPGDQVMSATMNVNGTFRFEATRVGEDTTLSQIIRLVDEAGNSKAPIARLADKVSGVFVPIVMGLALVTFIGWLIFGQTFSFALSNAIAVLVISCPCALGLATPLAIMVSTGKAAENGILIKSAEALETLQSINTVVLDKTGTITNGRPEVTSVVSFDSNLSDPELLALAAAAETGSEHPLGKAVVEKAAADGLVLETPTSFEAVSGRGLKAVLKKGTVTAGNLAYMEQEHIAVDEKAQASLEEHANQGETPLLFALNGKLIGMICVADTVRSDSRQALELLSKQGIQVVMLTGDNQKTANAIASSLAVDRVVSDVLPAEKESVIRSLQEEGRKVAMVGDGINDAPALARADVGLAIGAGTDIAIDSADIVLMKDSLLDVVTAIDLSRATIRNIRENLFWALFYNCLGIPVAMGLFWPAFGWKLSPMIGAAAMSFSSVTVCLNALRLRFFKPKGVSHQEAKELHETRAAVQKEEKIEENLPRILEETAHQEEKESIEASVAGMTCAHCQKRVTDAIAQTGDFEDVQVSLENNAAYALIKDGISREKAGEDLIKAVEKAGYTARIVSAQKEEPAEGTPQAAEEKPEKTPLVLEAGVEGMSCAHCQARVKQAIENTGDFDEVSVDLQNGSATMRAKAGVDEKKAKQDLNQAFEDLDYTLKDVHVLSKEEGSAAPETAENAAETASGEPEMVEMRLHVGGMSCAHCQNRVLKALEDVDGVKHADVSLAKEEAQIEAEKPISLEVIRQAVRDAGYEPGVVYTEEKKDGSSSGEVSQ